MSKVYTRFDRPKCIKQDLTKFLEPVFKWVFDEVKHKKFLVQVGETNVKEYIQSFAEEVDIYNIIKRYESGDLAALNKYGEPKYADVSELPRDRLETESMTSNAVDSFNNLDPRVKELVNNNIGDFLKANLEDIIKKIVDDGKEKKVDE